MLSTKKTSLLPKIFDCYCAYCLFEPEGAFFFDSYKEFNILSFQKAKLHQQNPLYVKYLKLFLHPTLFGFFTVANEMESCLCLFRSVFFAV